MSTVLMNISQAMILMFLYGIILESKMESHHLEKYVGVIC